MPVLEGLAVADLFMSKGQLLTYHVGPGQSVFIPMGYWHWIIAGSDETHDHVIFDNEQPESVEGSDVLRLTPPEVFQLAYGVDAEELAEVLAPINQTVVIGPVCPQVSDDRESPDEDEDEDEERTRGRHRDRGRSLRR